MEGAALVGTLIVGALIGLWGMKVWRDKGGSAVVGFVLGFFLGLVGMIIVFLATPSKASSVGDAPSQYTRECPHCRKQMRRDANVCPHCQRESEAWTFHDGRWWVQRTEGHYWLDDSTGQWQRFSG
jgi:hypothetical protein